MTARPSTRTTRAAFAFAWLRAVKRHPGLSRLDAWTALDLAELLSDDLSVYRSAAKLGSEIRCTRTAAAASLARLEAAGFLIRAEAKGRAGPAGGRPATTFRLTIPAEVLPNLVGITPPEVLPSGNGKTAEVLPSPDGRVLPSPDGTISMEQPLDGRGARTARAPAPNSPMDCEGAADGRDGARERATPPYAYPDDLEGRDLDLVPLHAPEAHDLRPNAADLSELDPALGRPADLRDLDRWTAEERAALTALADPDRDADPELDPLAECADDLAPIGLADPAALARDLHTGFIASRPCATAAARAAEAVARAMADAGGAGQAAVWRTCRRTAWSLALAMTDNPSRADAARDALHRAVAAAGARLLRARRTAETAATAPKETAHG